MMASPSARYTARWTAFRNSRTFPGQGCDRIARSDAGAKTSSSRPASSAKRRRKWSANSVTSSPRARSGGSRIEATFKRKNRSSRKRPSPIIASNGWFVAATTRTSTSIVSVDPTRVTVRCSNTRNNLAWAVGLRSPTSSRKIVPPSAASNFPARSSSAPVNDPRTCPNNSDSTNVSTIAAQLTAMNGSSRRGPLRCNRSATISLPVPFSPVTRTLRSVPASRSICPFKISIDG